MQLSNAASDIALGEWQGNYVYYDWMEDEDVPMDVTHVIVHPPVKSIKNGAFYNRRQLRIAILNDELEDIGEEALRECVLLERIDIPNAVKTIKSQAFCYCFGLMAVTLANGLEEIEL
jgi:hypothetical protein